MRVAYLFSVFAMCGVTWPGAAPAASPTRQTWQEAMLAAREVVGRGRDAREPAGVGAVGGDVWTDLEKRFPVECDWFVQDLEATGVRCTAKGTDYQRNPGKWIAAEPDARLHERLVARALEELGASGAGLRAEWDRLGKEAARAGAGRWLALYAKACAQRRQARLRPLLARCRALVFTKHYNLGGSHYAYTEAVSDGVAERHFRPGAALCLAEIDDAAVNVRTLLDDPGGVIRDPDVSYDGKRVLFSWKRSDREDDYHLYEMDVASGEVRQITFGRGFADYEGAYLANGDIVFNSTRCVQVVDCWYTEVSNLYTSSVEGKFLRRLGFDQVHTNFPTVTGDGRVVYTRWDYNDRGQIYPQALFQMNSDGTGQAEFYGNNSWFPTTILHARGIPRTQKVLAIATGHHSLQAGKLIVIDPAKGRQENSGVQLVAPVRPTPAVRIDAYGQDGELFQYPYPLSETEYLVTYTPWGWARPEARFAVYFMTADGRRELLVADPAISCNQPVPLQARPAPPVRPSAVDYAQQSGVYYVQDIYAGPGLEGIARGTIKRLRVVGLEYRAAVVGGNGNEGPAGGAFVSTPVAIGNGCWDPKIVLGEADVREDGSAMFVVPAHLPVYFQAIDQRGCAVQTMRSWSTLQPGETASCVGCHESKNVAPPVSSGVSLALKAGPQPLRPFHGPARGFSFGKEIQPILDRHCIRCHDDRTDLPFHKPEDAAGATGSTGGDQDDPDRSFSLLAHENVDPVAKRRWSDAYLVLTNARRQKKGAYWGRSTELVNWISVQSAPPLLPPYAAGAAKSRLMVLLEAGHKDVKLSREELEKIACWIDLLVPFCGDYTEAHAWSPDEVEHYQQFLAKRRRMEALERRNIEELLAHQRRSTPPRP